MEGWQEVMPFLSISIQAWNSLLLSEERSPRGERLGFDHLSVLIAAWTAGFSSFASSASGS